jgi:nucleoside-diphosphate-sugar epimerase
MPRALVTGATGFVGRALTARLLAEGWDVAALVRDPARLPAGVAGITADLARVETLEVAEPYDVVFHTAAQMTASISGADYLAQNGVATAALLETARAIGVRRFVYLSGATVIGHPSSLPITEDHPVVPITPYLLGKLAGEFASRIAQTPDFSTVSLRVSSPYGPGMNRATVLPAFVARGLAGETIQWQGSGSRAQDFVHVDDVAAGCLAAATAAAPGPLYNLASGTATTMRTLAEMIATQTGASAAASGQPDPQDGVRWDISLDRARAELGYDPRISLADGLAAYIASDRGA